ncbi:unnamed protein product [Arabidopsis halleri]
MFEGGFRGLVAPAQLPARVIKKGKRKCNAKLLPAKIDNGEASSSKKRKLWSNRSKPAFVDSNAKLLAAVSSQIRAVESVGVQTGNTKNSDSVQDATHLSHPYKADKIPSTKASLSTQPRDSVSLSSEESAEPSPRGTAGAQSSEPLLASGTEFDASSHKFKLLITHLVPTMELSVGDGLVLKDRDVINIPTSIPPDSPQVMDSCVLVMRDSLFSNVDPAIDPRVEFMHSNFPGSLAVLYAEFKKSTRKECFDFDPEVVSAVAERAKLIGREWINDIDFLYFPFNIDKNRWIAIMVNLRNHLLTVFDPTTDVRRGSRLKPQLDFICEMFPYFVRKVGLNDRMLSFPLEPLAFHRDTSVAQASLRTNIGILSLLFI